MTTGDFLLFVIADENGVVSFVELNLYDDFWNDFQAYLCSFSVLSCHILIEVSVTSKSFELWPDKINVRQFSGTLNFFLACNGAKLEREISLTENTIKWNFDRQEFWKI